MKIRKNKTAVSEVVGVAILLGISIALFAVVQVIVMAYPFNPSPPSVHLVGSIQGNTIYIEHHRGESISFSANILIMVDDIAIDANNDPNNLSIGDSDGNGLWGIGEIVSYTNDAFLLTSSQSKPTIIVIVVDSQSNSIIMNAKVQEGN